MKNLFLYSLLLCAAGVFAQSKPLPRLGTYEGTDQNGESCSMTILEATNDRKEMGVNFDIGCCYTDPEKHLPQFGLAVQIHGEGKEKVRVIDGHYDQLVGQLTDEELALGATVRATGNNGRMLTGWNLEIPLNYKVPRLVWDTLCPKQDVVPFVPFTIFRRV
jgi:hypothetical protein